MKILSTILLPAFLAAMGLWALWRWSRYRGEDGYCTACFAIAAVVILSNVFSPQYLIWAVPMMLLMALERFSKGQSRFWVLFGVVMGMIALTTWLFPFNYYRTETPFPMGSPYGLVPVGRTFNSPSPVACNVLVVRNAVYFGLVVWLGVVLIRSSNIESAAMPGGAEGQAAVSRDRSFASAKKQKKMRR